MNPSSKQFWLSVGLLLLGGGLLIAGIAIPPSGEIHPSVLVAFGEIATFAGSVIGIDYHYKYKMK